MMASDSTTPRVLTNVLLQASGNPTVRLLDAKAARVANNPTAFPDLLTTIETHLRDAPCERNLFDPYKLLAYSACFINLSESLRLARQRILASSRNRQALFAFWSSYKPWIEAFLSFVYTHSMAELEGNFTPSGVHDVWDLAGWVSLVLYEFALVPEIKDHMNASFEAAQIRLWVKVRMCSRPRILLEDQIGDVLNLILGLHEYRKSFEMVLDEFPKDFILQCYHRVIGRVRNPNFAMEGYDTWLSCFRFVIQVYKYSEPLWLTFLGHGCVYFQLYAFQRHMSPHSHINGHPAYLKFFRTLIYATAPAIADSPAWIPQAIDCHLLPIIFGSAMFYDDIRERDPSVDEDMLQLFKHLTPALIHRSVLKRVLRSLHQLRTKYGSLQHLFDGAVHDAWVGFLRHADDMKSFLSYLKTSGLDFSDCFKSQAFYCSRECQKAHWKDHREDCKKALAERQKGTVLLHADARHEAFVLAHANYMVSCEGKFTQLLEDYKRTDPRAPAHNIVTVLDYTEAPPKLSVAHAFAYMTKPDWQSTVDEAQAGRGQLAYISIPYIANEAQHFFVLLDHAGDAGSRLPDTSSVLVKG
ncbi:hypothetical protein BDZ89DRAFT_1058117 [Hymenopellis radicata]|nr:hypothetical protein BDZ89DRAFT_1058117 [Hymenopellis radicata]